MTLSHPKVIQALRSFLCGWEDITGVVDYAGTSGTHLPSYPAALPFVLGVCASDVQCVAHDPVTYACLQVAEAQAPFSNSSPAPNPMPAVAHVSPPREVEPSNHS